MLFGRAIGLVLDNAIKHAGKEAVIDVEYGIDDRGWFVSVRDHGPGIQAGREEEIFSKYTRLSRNDQQNAGTGLGLAICKKIIEQQGGRIWVESKLGKGATFFFTLPGNEAVRSMDSLNGGGKGE